MTKLDRETFEPCDVVERLGHFDGIVPSLACILTKQHGVHAGKYLLKTPGNARDSNFKISLEASALKDLCLWCEFQCRLLFIISLLLVIKLFENPDHYFYNPVGKKKNFSFSKKEHVSVT